jgi:hypothetical protein
MSRTAPWILASLATAWPGAAPAALQDEVEAAAPTAEAVIQAYRHRTEGAMRRRCTRGGPDDEILVCGRSIENERQALPLGSQPDPVARRRLIAGEVPSGIDALNAPGACCGHGGGGLNVIAIVNALGAGVDRILHPD